MFDFPKLEKLAYTFESGADLFDMPTPKFTELVRKYRLRTFRVKRTDYLPNFEADRLVSILLQEQVQRDIDQAKPKTNHHGTG